MKSLITLILSMVVTFTSFAGVGGNVGGSSGGSGSNSSNGSEGRKLPSIFKGKRLETLEDYDASLSYIVEWPMVKFAQNNVPVKNICDDGTIFKTINPIKICKETAVVEVCNYGNSKNTTDNCRPVRKGEVPKDGYGIKLNYGCIAYEFVQLETSQFYEAPVCDNWSNANDSKSNGSTWKCLKYGKETKEYSENYIIPVIQIKKDHSGTREEVTKLEFEIPDCKLSSELPK